MVLFQNAQFFSTVSHLIPGMIMDLFIDQHKFKGKNVKDRVPQLLDVLKEYNL